MRLKLFISYFISCIIIFSFAKSYAGISRGYSSLENYKFDIAFTEFTKYRNKAKPNTVELSEAYFAFYCYYNHIMNPNRNYQKAWTYLDSANTSFVQPLEISYMPFENKKISKTEIAELKNEVCESAFKSASNKNTIPLWIDYLNFYQDKSNAKLLQDASNNLHNLAFNACNKSDTVALHNYLVTYPNSSKTPLVNALLDTLLFNATLHYNDKNHYQYYINTRNNSPFVTDAKDSIEQIDYTETVKANSTASMKAFISTYPKSKKINNCNNWLCNTIYDSVKRINTKAAYNYFAENYGNCDQAYIAKQKIKKFDCINCLQNPTVDCLQASIKKCVDDESMVDSLVAKLSTLLNTNPTKVEAQVAKPENTSNLDNQVKDEKPIKQIEPNIPTTTTDKALDIKLQDATIIQNAFVECKNQVIEISEMYQLADGVVDTFYEVLDVNTMRVLAVLKQYSVIRTQLVNENNKYWLKVHVTDAYYNTIVSRSINSIFIDLFAPQYQVSKKLLRSNNDVIAVVTRVFSNKDLFHELTLQLPINANIDEKIELLFKYQDADYTLDKSYNNNLYNYYKWAQTPDNKGVLANEIAPILK